MLATAYEFPERFYPANPNFYFRDPGEPRGERLSTRAMWQRSNPGAWRDDYETPNRNRAAKGKSMTSDPANTTKVLFVREILTTPISSSFPDRRAWGTPLRALFSIPANLSADRDI